MGDLWGVIGPATIFCCHRQKRDYLSRASQRAINAARCATKINKFVCGLSNIVFFGNLIFSCVLVLTGSRLRLVLNAEGYDYSDDSLAAGLHLVLHSPEVGPQLLGYDSRDIVLTAGTRTLITVRVCSLLLNLN